MKIKLFEIRDKATMIPVICIRVSGLDGWLFRHSGFGINNNFVFLVRMGKGTCTYNAYDYGDRTFHTAHKFIQDNWDSLQSEDVVDVEYILDETKERKISERYYHESI